MTRKAARGRKTAAQARTSAARRQARTTTRTGRKTASARATKSPTRTPTKGNAAASRPAQAAEAEAIREPLPAAQHEDDEDTDWLGEDEDPRSQIVEDDDEWEPAGDDEW